MAISTRTSCHKYEDFWLTRYDAWCRNLLEVGLFACKCFTLLAIDLCQCIRCFNNNLFGLCLDI